VAIVIGLALGHAAVYGVQASFYAELFGTRVRYSGPPSATRSRASSAAPWHRSSPPPSIPQGARS
jgi:hypothetical protein